MIDFDDSRWTAVGVAAVTLFWMVGAHHRLRGLRTATAEAYVQVDVQLRQRHAHVQTLLDTLRPLLESEQSTLDTVASALRQVQAAAATARSRPTQAEPIAQLGTAENTLASALARLLALVEHHAEVQARDDVVMLTAELRDIDAKLVVSRHVFNGVGDRYNRAVRQFPTRLLTRLFGFRPAGQL